MKILPYDSFKILTPLPLNQAAKRIRARSDEQKSGWLLQSSKAEFRGTVLEDEFKLVENSSNRNSFLPVLTGTFRKAESGTLVDVAIGPQISMFIFMFLWLLLVGYGAFRSISDLVTNGATNQSITYLLVTIGMLIAGFIAPLVIFWFGVNRQKKRLIQLVKGKEV